VIPDQSEHAQKIKSKSKSNVDNATAATDSNSSRNDQLNWDDSNMGNYTTTINSGSQEESGNEAYVPPQLEGAVSGLALLKRKM
jgi:hypothetical protein